MTSMSILRNKSVAYGLCKQVNRLPELTLYAADSVDSPKLKQVLLRAVKRGSRMHFFASTIQSITRLEVSSFQAANQRVQMQWRKSA